MPRRALRLAAVAVVACLLTLGLGDATRSTTRSATHTDDSLTRTSAQLSASIGGEGRRRRQRRRQRRLAADELAGERDETIVSLTRRLEQTEGALRRAELQIRQHASAAGRSRRPLSELPPLSDDLLPSRFRHLTGNVAVPAPEGVAAEREEDLEGCDDSMCTGVRGDCTTRDQEEPSCAEGYEPHCAGYHHKARLHMCTPI